MPLTQYTCELQHNSFDAIKCVHVFLTHTECIKQQILQAPFPPNSAAKHMHLQLNSILAQWNCGTKMASTISCGSQKQSEVSSGEGNPMQSAVFSDWSTWKCTHYLAGIEQGKPVSVSAGQEEDLLSSLPPSWATGIPPSLHLILPPSHLPLPPKSSLPPNCSTPCPVFQLLWHFCQWYKHTASAGEFRTGPQSFLLSCPQQLVLLVIPFQKLQVSIHTSLTESKPD